MAKHRSGSCLAAEGRGIDEAADPSLVVMQLKLARVIELVGAQGQLMRDEELSGRPRRNAQLQKGGRLAQ